ncbi:hypothetical protein TIFTF001_052171 [Ficus carica]|uniref:Uncharacterized protein n=1 Tax=Ficus carica TaxID=3494 RepID=A0AA88JGL3_FICCA|nr:hypothetical protein TIFTF001_052171 [Ficus carica]
MDVYVVLTERKLTSYVYAVGSSLQSWYQSGLLLSDFTVCLPSPPSLPDDMDPARVDEDRDAVLSFYESHPLIFDADARLWWMTIGDREMPSRTWAHFRTIVIARYGPVPNEGAGVPYRDPEIYRDMHHTRYLSYVADWHTYPQETMSHYCRRFQEAMLPHIPQELHSPELQALVILQNGLPPQIRQYVPIPILGMTVGNMIDDILGAKIVAHAMQADDFVGDHQAPVDNAGMGESIHKAGPVFPEDPVPAVLLQEVPPQEAEVDMGADDFDPADFIVTP